MPMPLSSTTATNCTSSSPIPLTSRRTRTSPCSVNLMALLTRLERICLKQDGSTITSSWVSRSRLRDSFRPFCHANPSNTLTTDSTNALGVARRGSRTMRPDSILAISRMSPISASRELAESWATVIASRSSPSRFRASSSMPMMAFSGVRIS
ncbi:hypothetical protein D9M71_550140 [compost metagenome]